MRVLYAGPEQSSFVGPGTYLDALMKWMSRHCRVGLMDPGSTRLDEWDILHVPDIMWARPEVLRSFKGATIVDVHDYYWTRFHPFFCPDLPLRWIMQRLRKRRYQEALAACDTVLTHCDFTTRSFRHPRVVNVSQGIDPAEYEGIPVTGDPSQPVILFVGGNFLRKGALTLIRAMPAVRRVVPGARCVLVGNERPLSWWTVKLAALGTPVEFRQRIPREEVKALLVNAAVFVLPSKIEAFPFTLMEAMAAGVPSVATSVGGIPEMLLHGVNGLLVPAGDAGRLAGEIIRVLTDRSFHDHLARGGRYLLRTRFTLDAMAHRILGVYEEAMHGRRESM
ncbi:glycosyltransferase family 4 protein [bacterium]|nr:glycosyltransferase family 4 protein [candidate division CSSED10-310 bacterium]